MQAAKMRNTTLEAELTKQNDVINKKNAEVIELEKRLAFKDGVISAREEDTRALKEELEKQLADKDEVISSKEKTIEVLKDDLKEI